MDPIIILWLLVGLLSIVGYLALLFGGGKLVEFFLGDEASWLFYDVVGFPMNLIAAPLAGAGNLISMPWRRRNRRLFREAFGFIPEEGYVKSSRDQGEVDNVLARRAARAQDAFAKQEEAREEWRRRPEEVDLGWYSELATEAKREFWQAHKLARTYGYEAPETIEACAAACEALPVRAR